LLSKECVIPLETETGRYALEQILTGIKSHFVYPTIGADYIEEKKLVVVFRDVESKGTLRDLLFQSKWSRLFSEKYTTKRGTTFSETRVCTWGRHILEGIMALRVKGFPPGHIHAGNVVVENNVCRITDYENKLLNLRPANMAIIQSQALASRGVDPDVASFGAILFEMCTGEAQL
jgi:PX domain-containing protein kinase-like protein